MVAFESLLITVPLIGVGLLIALAGRALHHLVVSVTGFMIGFLGVMIAYGVPRVSVEWWEGDLLGFLFVALLAVGIALVVGYITLMVAWMAYMFAVMLPGWIGGGAAGLALMAPIEGIDVIVVFVFAILGGMLMWALHEFLLVVSTALLGGIIVAVGITGAQLMRLPVVQQPGRLLQDPMAVLSNTLGSAELFGLTVIVVFLLGVVVQFGLTGGAAEG